MTDTEKQAPAAGTVSKEERTMGMLCHLLGIIGFLGPLIIWLIKKDQMPFVETEGKESLNFQITLLIAWAAAIVLAIVTCGFGAVLFPLVMIVNLVFVIMGAMKANEGTSYKYPFNLRLIK